jgi:hypothetical protein
MNFEENKQQSNVESKDITPAETENDIERFVDTGVERALLFIKDKYENQANPIDNLDFHNSRHTKGVIERVDVILEALGANKRTKQDGRLASANHDTIQDWKPDQKPDGSIIRKRDVGGNENASAKIAEDYMDEVNKKEGKIVFIEDDKKLVRDGIIVTKPGWDQERSTVKQDGLNEKSADVVRALALADLGAAGMDGPAQYIYEGNALFREENIDVLLAMQEPEKLTDEQKENFRKRMLDWSNFQPKFADGRKARFEMEIAGLPEGGKEKLRKLFNKFDESVDAARNKAKERESMTLEELAKDFGY